MDRSSGGAEREPTSRAGQAKRSRERDLEALLAIIGTVSSSLDVDDVYEEFAQQTRKLFDWDCISVALLDESGQSVTVRLIRATYPCTVFQRVTLPRKGSIAGWVAEHRHPLVHTVEPGARRFAEDELLLAHGIRQYVSVPMVVDQKVLGSLNMGSRKPNAYGQQDIPLLQAIAAQLGFAMERSRLYKEMREANQRLVGASVGLQEAVEEAQRRAGELETVLGEVAQRETLLARIVDQAPFHISFFDREMRWRYVGRAEAAIHGSTPEQLIGRPVWETVPRFADQLRAAFERVLAGESVHCDAYRAVTEDGVERSWRLDYQPVRDEEGRIIGVLSSSIDVTEQIKTQQQAQDLAAAAQSRARELETVIESIADAVFVCDAKGNITLINSAGLALIGVQRGGALRTLADYLNALQLRFPNGRPVTLDELAITRALKGEVVRSAARAGTRPGAGQRLDLLVSAAPLRDAEGRVVGAVEVAADVSRLRELGEVAQRRAAELRGIIDNMLDGVFVCDAEGTITFANDAGLQLLGLSNLAEVRHALFEDPTLLKMRRGDGRPVAPEDLPLVRALAGQLVVQEEEIIYNPHAQRDVYVRTSAAPIRDETGKIVSAVAVARDVSEITELDRLKDEFISVAAHELKTPVAIMKGYAQALLRGPEKVSPTRRKMFEAINRGSDRIDRIVSDLLDISRLHIGHLELAVERVDLADLVKQVVDRTELATPRHHLQLVRAEPAVVRGDRDRLEQVVASLIDNAIKYSPKGGDVDVAVDVQDGQAVVSVRDYGVGIPRARQRRIFERFYRAHTGTPYDYGGMGVGLYIAREIVARHGGSIWFESAEGKGSAFYFSLPLAPDDH